MTLNEDGSINSEIKYSAFGETRTSLGIGLRPQRRGF